MPVPVTLVSLRLMADVSALRRFAMEFATISTCKSLAFEHLRGSYSPTWAVVQQFRVRSRNASLGMSHTLTLKHPAVTNTSVVFLMNVMGLSMSMSQPRKVVSLAQSLLRRKGQDLKIFF